MGDPSGGAPAPPAATTAACQEMFGEFARHTASSAPLYSRLAADIAADADLAALLLHAPPLQRQPVLLFAAVHWLLLAEPDDPLARFYPNLHREAIAPEGAIEAWRRFCGLRLDTIVGLLGTRRTQTNEIGRTALFLPVFGLLAAEQGPLVHVDVGASAGLNLLMSHYDYRYEPGGAVGYGSPIVLPCGTRGGPPIPPEHPHVARAVGLDADPVDVTDPEQARWLEACVWPDQVERFGRLAAAVGVAVDTGVEVRRGDAVADVAGVVDAATAGGAGHPVVTTSWVLNYLTPGERHGFVAALDRLGAGRDLSWVYAESPVLCPELPGAPDGAAGRTATAVVLVRWRDGRRTVATVADAHPHGRWLHWITTGQRG